jgi:hypothetical protein
MNHEEKKVMETFQALTENQQFVQLWKENTEGHVSPCSRISCMMLGDDNVFRIEDENLFDEAIGELTEIREDIESDAEDSGHEITDEEYNTNPIFGALDDAEAALVALKRTLRPTEPVEDNPINKLDPLKVDIYNFTKKFPELPLGSNPLKVAIYNFTKKFPELQPLESNALALFGIVSGAIDGPITKDILDRADTDFFTQIGDLHEMASVNDSDDVGISTYDLGIAVEEIESIRALILKISEGMDDPTPDVRSQARQLLSNIVRDSDALVDLIREGTKIEHRFWLSYRTDEMILADGSSEDDIMAIASWLNENLEMPLVEATFTGEVNEAYFPVDPKELNDA